MKESKRDKFVRVAEARTNKIIGMIKLLGNCSNKNTYEYSKEDVKTFVENKYYRLNYDLNDLQRNNVFSSKCSVCVPQALFVFFESDSFEDSIRKALSIGGDTDTIACIVGSVSEAYYGVPDKLKDGVRPYLKPYMYNLLENRYFKRGEMK